MRDRDLYHPDKGFRIARVKFRYFPTVNGQDRHRFGSSILSFPLALNVCCRLYCTLYSVLLMPGWPQMTSPLLWIVPCSSTLCTNTLSGEQGPKSLHTLSPVTHTSRGYLGYCKGKLSQYCKTHMGLIVLLISAALKKLDV